ncbi:MAG TPA: hypothetical protein VKA68_17560 [bacterium]|nr:hypothetical protein [bacterium]
MSERYDFISGIYNYCDYVCEKCAFTQRCYLYWSENHPEEDANPLETDIEDLVDNYEEFEDDFEEDEDFFADFRDTDSERRTQEIIAPSVRIVELLDPVMEELAVRTDIPAGAQQGISLVLENYLLITVKYYRAVHQTDFNENAEIDHIGMYSYMDTEMTLLALKAFNWNLRNGLNILPKYFPEYLDQFTATMELSRLIEERIDTELLPATRSILSKHSQSQRDSGA